MKPSAVQAPIAVETQAAATGFTARPEVQAFIVRVAKQDQLDPAWITRALAQAQHRDDIIASITRPYEAKPWYQYRPIFLTDARIAAGVQFWNAHAATLARAERVYRVNASMIVAIIGIESYYGRQRGGYRVLDALATLGFDYPSRGEFFQKELEQFLLMCSERGLDPSTVMGSYAGAMGAPQFMPDSYRQYAVDFDADGKHDIWDDWDDIIGSVANYFQLHGWQQDALIAVPAAWPHPATPIDTLAPATVGVLRKQGVFLSSGIGDDQEAILITLQQVQGMDYWVGLHNFRVIMRYNKSTLYAMAATELAERISQLRTTQARHAFP
ncbi:MAG TPA: lytic murein transglycosylase B [Gammaproteobacteria bacterium]|nr:lytic murein transglycosylase B [Gammaproteobacteria bacterium]